MICDIDWLSSPVVLINDAAIIADSHGLPSVADQDISRARDSMNSGGLATPELNGQEFAVVVRDEMIRHYFHFMETLLILYAACREFHPNLSPKRIYFGRVDWNNPAQANVQRHLIEILFPTSELICDLGSCPIYEKHTVYIDRASARSFINKMIEPVLFLVAKWAPSLREEVYSALNITNRKSGKPCDATRVLYVRREPPRSLSPDGEKELLEFLGSFADVAVANFAAMAWSDQVRLACDNDIIIGVHGNGLTNLIWLRPNALVIELFPEGVHHYDYQMMSEVMQLDYFGIEGNKIYRQFSRYGTAYGHNTDAHKPVTELRRTEIALALGAHARARML